MKHFELILIGTQFILFVVVLSNIARLATDYLITKIK